MASRDPARRRQAARIAGLARQARAGVDGTAAATAGALRKFETQVDLTGELPPAERRRRALLARRAHMLQLALRSAKVRAARKAQAAPA